MTTLKKQLEGIYNAKQCTDKSDVEIAISQTMELVKLYDWTPALQKRVASLQKKSLNLKS